MPVADKSKLQSPLPAVVTALEELMGVLTAGGSPVYNSAEFWGKASLAEATTYLDDLDVNPNLKATIQKVTGPVPGFSGALSDATTAINGFINNVSQTANGVTGDVIPAIAQLNTPHASGTFGTGPTDNYGYIPGILGVANAAGLNVSGVQGVINTAVGVAQDSVTYAFFTLLATKTLARLTESLGN